MMDSVFGNKGAGIGIGLGVFGVLPDSTMSVYQHAQRTTFLGARYYTEKNGRACGALFPRITVSNLVFSFSL